MSLHKKWQFKPQIKVQIHVILEVPECASSLLICVFIIMGLRNQSPSFPHVFTFGSRLEMDESHPSSAHYSRFKGVVASGWAGNTGDSQQ